MEFLSDAQLLKTVTGIGAYYHKLVKEFIVNLPSSLNKPDSPNFMMVYVKDHGFNFSPTVINDFLGRGKIINVDKLPSIHEIIREISGDEDKE